MIEHIFSQEMMNKREEQLIYALLDCSNVLYDINITQNRIEGNPIQVVNGVAFPVLERIGKQKNCPYTEIIDYWANVLPKSEKDAYIEFSLPENILNRYKTGERQISHSFITSDSKGNPILAEQTIRLYENEQTGDVYGLTYVKNTSRQHEYMIKEEELLQKYSDITDKAELLEYMSKTVPAGYHRCGTGDGFPLMFVSNSFLEVVGYTKEQLSDELDNRFIKLVAPEDVDFFMSHEPILKRDGKVSLTYRLRRRDGSYRWIQDDTIHIKNKGVEYYQCTLADITDYVNKLNEEKARAEESSQAKSTFLFNISHDIRTPMNAIIGFMNFIKNSDNLETIKNDYIPKIETSCNQLLMLINDALEMSRIESGKLTFNRDVQDIRDIINGIITIIEIQAKEKNIDFVTDISVQNPIVNCDGNHLNRAILNLLSNAVKFTDKGGRVALSVHELSDSPDGYTAFEIKVADTGIGMTPEFIEKLFTPFEREHTSTESGLQGTGLGLAIVKRIVDTAGDKLSVKSVKGEGTEFTLITTLLKGDESILPKATDSVIKVSHEKMAEFFSGKRVLIAEDNEFNLTIAKTLLEEVGFVVDTAEDGRQAVNRIMGVPFDYYDAILMDIQMPIMDGYEATRAIRALPDKHSEVKIIAVTANAFDTDKKNAEDAGMNAHISKPISVDELYRVLLKQLS